MTNTPQPQSQPEKTQAEKADQAVAVKTLGAAGLTGVSSLFIWMYSEVVDINDRLSTLETKVNVVLDPDGTVRPSPQAMRTAIQLENVQRRIDRLEEK